MVSCKGFSLVVLFFIGAGFILVTNLRITLKVEYNVKDGGPSFDIGLFDIAGHTNEKEGKADSSSNSFEAPPTVNITSMRGSNTGADPVQHSDSNAKEAAPRSPVKQVVPDTNKKSSMRGSAKKKKSNFKNKKAGSKRPAKQIAVDSNKTTIELVLLRAIGNALPPRHDPEQAYKNLKFTLENEHEFPHLQKQWVLNRLVDESLQQRLINLLESHGQKYTIIPFNLTEYDKVQYQFQYYQPLRKSKDVVHHLQYIRQAKIGKNLQVGEAIKQDKNVFVTNQNAARNVMLDIGAAYPNIDWVLPWDGNCFLHPNAYESIYQQLQDMPSNHKYAFTPMNRAKSNEEVVQDTYAPNAIEEPQIIFHRTAKGRFHPLLRYGARNKSELLQRLGIKGPWDGWGPVSQWEEKALGPFYTPIPDLQKDEETRKVGWVTRLSSGKENLETEGSIIQRSQARVEAMHLMLSNLDTRAVIELHGYQPGQLIFYNERALTRDRQLYLDNDPRVKPVVDSLLNLAKQALAVGPWAVTDKPDSSVAKSGDKHDYYHLAPFYHPKTEYAANDPNHKWVFKDGVRYPGTGLDDVGSENFDQTRVKDLHYNTTVLGLAYFMTGEKEYAQVAARNIRTWFLNPETRMNPNLNYALVRKGHYNNAGVRHGIIEMKDMYFMLDSVRLIERDGFLTDEEQTGLRQWFTEYLEWLETSSMGEEEYAATDNHGLYFDVQATAIASYINDTAKMIMYIEKSTSRLLAHVKSDGTMPEELSRPTCEHNQMFTLQGWSILSRMAQTVNRNLWKYSQEASPFPLCRAAKYSIPYYGRKAKCRSKIAQDDNVDRWLPLLHESQSYCADSRDEGKHWPAWFPPSAKKPPSSSYEMPSLYHPQDGIAPFWNLGMIHTGDLHALPWR